ncbi:MAG: uroporphyrinogen-III C-methyltransferase, partial [Nitrosomonas sp.]|nr:uroporphyrinogen-III C-methyltransferase [Nitrosomonas sp.]
MNRDTQGTSKLKSRFISLLLAPFFAALIIWQWPLISGKILEVKETAENFIADIDAFGENSRALMVAVEETKLATEERLTQLENHLVKSQELELAIESFRETFDADADDEKLLEEVTQLIHYADQHLSVTLDTDVALESLRQAKALLKNARDAQFSVLYESIAKDIESLEAIPETGTATMRISYQLRDMAASIKKLPLQMNADLKEVDLDFLPSQEPTEEKLWLKFLDEIWSDVKEFVRIQKVNNPDTEILSPSQIHFLNENLKLKFMLMQFSLLSHDKTSFDA